MLIRIISQVVVIVLGSSISAHAAEYFRPNSNRGLETFSFTSPNNYTEQCILPRAFPNTSYSKGALKDMRELCEVDFYDFSASTDKAVCPKLFSTSPGLEVYQFDSEEASSRDDFELKYCAKARNRPGKKIAKYKQSITCSYTPSPLAYYQVAEVLGDILHIPQLVIRTMDKQEHYKQVERGQKLVKALYSNPSTIVRYAWERNWSDAHNNPEGSSAKPFPTAVKAQWIFTDDLQGIYGSLMENARGEKTYSEVSGKYVYDTRYETFKQQRPYQNIANRQHVQNFIPNDFASAAYNITQMKDVSDMVIIDTLLNQQDRVGNIAYLDYAYYLVGNEVKSKKVDLDKSGKISSEDLAKINQKNPTEIALVKEMLLKDNDCGVAKSNMARISDWIEGIYHVSPKTYYRLLWLAEAVQDPAVKEYFMTELLFNQEDWDGGRMKFKNNVEFAARHLKEKCISGELMLDLDLNAFLNGSLSQDFRKNCELPSGFSL